MTTTRSKLNMSDFLAGLNTSPTATEQPDDFSQLDVFANTDWFNVDVGEPLQSTPEYSKKSSMASENLQWDRLNNSDILGNDFQFNPLQLSTSKDADYPIDSALFTPSQSTSSTGTKRKIDLLDPALVPTERARIEAEEDKRRRNTAASARFRVKKKQREQALEKSAKEMTDKADQLEKRVNELELENKWLKGLITEQSGGVEFGDLFAKYLAENQSKEDAKEATTS